MFKTTGKSGFRRSRGSGGGVRRVSATRLVHVTEVQQHRRAAFLPDTPQEQTFDSNSPRLQGLEKRK